jgi:hypothetical protein
MVRARRGIQRSGCESGGRDMEDKERCQIDFIWQAHGWDSARGQRCLTYILLESADLGLDSSLWQRVPPLLRRRLRGGLDSRGQGRSRRNGYVWDHLLEVVNVEGILGFAECVEVAGGDKVRQ